MANKKISELSELSSPQGSDVLPIVDSTNSITNKVTVSNLIDLVDKTITQNAQTAAYTLAASDAHKHISITTGGVTVPPDVFSVGEAVGIYNNSSADQTITQGTGVSIRIGGTATAANRTLAGYGFMTILCIASNEFVCVGAGVS